MPDREIRDLQVATIRAYDAAERLALELNSTVRELLEYINGQLVLEVAQPRRRRK